AGGRGGRGRTPWGGRGGGGGPGGPGGAPPAGTAGWGAGPRGSAGVGPSGPPPGARYDTGSGDRAAARPSMSTHPAVPAIDPVEPPADDFDFTRPAFRRDPYPTYRRLRATTPLHCVERGAIRLWVPTRHR